MSHYLDLHLLSDPEFPAAQLLSALYTKLHRALVQGSGVSSIAATFPDYGKPPGHLGVRLRLIGSPADLDSLMVRPWLQGMRDHVRIDPMAVVPANATLRCLQRVQAKSSPERLRRRQMRRHGLTAEQAAERIPESARETLDLPFVVLTSASTGQTFHLFLRLGPPLSGPLPGTFNAYGLSATATTPWF